jgi:hypothetical protein
MTDKEAMKLALGALVSINPEFVCNSAHHAKKDRHEFDEECPVNMRYRTAIAVLEEQLENHKKWVGLTDDEATALWEGTDDRDSWELIKQVEKTLKWKNT